MDLSIFINQFSNEFNYCQYYHDERSFISDDDRSVISDENDVKWVRSDA